MFKLTTVHFSACKWIGTCRDESPTYCKVLPSNEGAYFKFFVDVAERQPDSATVVHDVVEVAHVLLARE